MKIGLSKGAREVLCDHFLVWLGRELLEFLCESSARSEDRCTGRYFVHDVNDVLAVALSVFFKQLGNDLARFGDLLNCEEACGVLVLSVDDDQS